MINYDDFKKVELKVATIISAERVKDSDKLLHLMVNAGDQDAEGSSILRQLVSGIGKAYDPATLVGQQVVIVANLEPRTLMGLESNGMVLAAGSQDGPTLLAPFAPVEPGTIIG